MGKRVARNEKSDWLGIRWNWLAEKRHSPDLSTLTHLLSFFRIHCEKATRRWERERETNEIQWSWIMWFSCSPLFSLSLFYSHGSRLTIKSCSIYISKFGPKKKLNGFFLNLNLVEGRNLNFIPPEFRKTESVFCVERKLRRVLELG